MSIYGEHFNERERESKGTNIVIDIFASALRLSGGWTNLDRFDIVQGCTTYTREPSYSSYKGVRKEITEAPSIHNACLFPCTSRKRAIYIQLWRRDRNAHNKESQTNSTRYQENRSHIQTYRGRCNRPNGTEWGQGTTASRVHRDSHTRVMVPR